jgi:DNA-binding PadR family transcriptional regulator
MAVKNPALPMNVKTLCLGSLYLMDGTGYDIKKLFEEAFSHFHSASYGSIYPSLNRLQREGLIELRVEPGERHPDRKVYSITEAGRRAFMEEIVQTEPTEQLRSEFMVLLFFAHLLPSERLTELLDHVCRHHREALAYLESLQECDDNTAGIRFVIGLGTATLQAKLAFIESQRAKLLEEHRAVPRSWPEKKS